MTEGFKKKRINLAQLGELKARLRGAGLHTVCESARCPNIGECFSRGTATFLIAGSVCTRGCAFCAVDKGAPRPLDEGEPERVAETVAGMHLRYAVVTSVTRDDLPDGGAGHFARTVRAVRARCPGVKVEILVPDFAGDRAAALAACAASPDVFAHNIETVPRLYPAVRSRADYRRSLDLLAFAADRGLVTKSGLMLGLGETRGEVLAAMTDLRAARCELLTLGQYLAPTDRHHPVREHLSPEAYEDYRTAALALGFSHCASAPYVRSSYMAETSYGQAMQGS